jgi:hypothetical protein
MADKKKLPPIVFENCRILHRNFNGEKKKFNPEGERNFNLALDPEIAEKMLADKWNVKYLKPRDEDDVPQAILKVRVAYNKGRPPRIVMITSRGKTNLDESTVGLLDYADFDNIDLIINPYYYDVDGREGYSAYLSSFYAKIREDPLELKYADITEVGPSAAMTDADETPF